MQRRLRAGDRVDGRFRVVERLAEGGTAEVFKARDPKRGRDVALKIQLSRTFEHTSDFQSYGGDIKHDFETLQLLSAVEGIPRAYHLGFHEERQYAVYELIHGKTLDEFARENWPLNAVYTACILDQLAQILDDIHRHGHVHRDVKPENAMIQPDGRIRILDLGAAISVDCEDSRQIRPCGTDGYSAPEQYDLDVVPTPRADIYALGCIVFQVAAMRLPYAEFSGRPDLRFDPFPNRSVLAKLPAGLLALGLEMIAHDPACRPSSMAAVRERLRQLDLIPLPGTAADPKAPDPDPSLPFRRPRCAPLTPPRPA